MNTRVGERRTRPSGRLDATRAAGGPSGMLGLQATCGNQAVLQLLGHTDADPAIQRLIDRAAFAGKLTRNPKTFGGKGLNNILDAIADFHRAGTTDAVKIVPLLSTVIELCSKWLQNFPANSTVDGDPANQTAVKALLEEATRDKAKAEGKPEPEKPAAAAAVIPVLPADPGRRLEQRLAWMAAKAQQANATTEQREALPVVAAAEKELVKVMKRQNFLMSADEADKKQEFQKGSVLRQRADNIVLGTGEKALSAMLGKLFRVFRFTPLAFQGTDAQAKLTEFANTAKLLLKDLAITTHKGDTLSNFDDTVLIISGSSALGYSPHKGTEFGPQSDVDLGVVSVKLFNACSAAGGEKRGLGDRTEPDPLPEIRALSKALETLVTYSDRGKTKNRKVSIMVYKTRSAAQRQPGIEVG